MGSASGGSARDSRDYTLFTYHGLLDGFLPDKFILIVGLLWDTDVGKSVISGDGFFQVHLMELF